MTRLENNTKAEKLKPLRRKTVADSIIAPLLDSKSTQNSANKGTKSHKSLVYEIFNSIICPKWDQTNLWSMHDVSMRVSKQSQFSLCFWSLDKCLPEHNLYF